MPYWPPDTPPVPPAPFPATASGPGPADVPFTGPDQGTGNPKWAPAELNPAFPGVEVLNGTTGTNAVVVESALRAPNVNPYEAGSISPIYVGGDPDAGGRDDVAATVAAAVHAAEARSAEHQAETYGMGSHIGDLMTLPPNPLDPGVGTLGQTEPAGGYYDPPRNYA